MLLHLWQHHQRCDKMRFLTLTGTWQQGTTQHCSNCSLRGSWIMCHCHWGRSVIINQWSLLPIHLSFLLTTEHNRWHNCPQIKYKGRLQYFFVPITHIRSSAIHQFYGPVSAGGACRHSWLEKLPRPSFICTLPTSLSSTFGAIQRGYPQNVNCFGPPSYIWISRNISEYCSSPLSADILYVWSLRSFPTPVLIYGHRRHTYRGCE